MAGVDIDPFGKHESRPQEPTDEIFLLPQLEEDQFGNWNVNRKYHSEGNLWKLLNMKPWKVLLKVCIKGYLEATIEPSGRINFHNFDLRNGQLYYKDNVNPLMTKKRVLRGVGVLADRLGKEGLRDLGFDVLVGKITARQFMASYRVGSQLPSTFDITGADDIELQEIAKKHLEA